ncbi:Zeta-sarcoglycan [Cyphomyrmex costatus]|uniref:Zeta-sarcoglycan n=1 Tax=Cyphomyrmex costatus TaxID=456900 RepID=A0A195D3E2_9HYME|nr:Zeta-sarcoglycan [Cyphomyrmex costatus]
MSRGQGGWSDEPCTSGSVSRRSGARQAAGSSRSASSTVEERASSNTPCKGGFRLGVYGWRKKCLYSLVLTLMIIVILNLALTVWLLKVMGFNSSSTKIHIAHAPSTPIQGGSFRRIASIQNQLKSVSDRVRRKPKVNKTIFVPQKLPRRRFKFGSRITPAVATFLSISHFEPPIPQPGLYVTYQIEVIGALAQPHVVAHVHMCNHMRYGSRHTYIRVRRRNVRLLVMESIRICGLIHQRSCGKVTAIRASGARKWNAFVILEGIGSLKVVPGGIELRGQAAVLDALVASSLRSQRGKNLVLESWSNFTASARSHDGRLLARLTVGEDRVDCVSRGFRITDPRGGVLFSADREQVIVGAEMLRVTGDGGAVFQGSVQTPLVRGESGRGLKLESATRSLKISAPQRVVIESWANEISASCLTDLKLQSVHGAIRLDAKSVYIKGLKTAVPVQGHSSREQQQQQQQHSGRSSSAHQSQKETTIYQLCACASGKLFLARPDGSCQADKSIC